VAVGASAHGTRLAQFTVLVKLHVAKSPLATRSLPGRDEDDMATGTFYYAGQLFGIAKQAYNRAKESCQTDRHFVEGDPLVAVIFSAASTEAFISELRQSAQTHFGFFPELGPTPDRVDDLATLLNEVDERGSITLKYQIAKLALTGKTPDRGQALFQDFATLADLRNSLMHMKYDHIKSVRIGEVDVQHPSVIAKLCSKNILALLEGDDAGDAVAGWVHRMSTPAVARWACNTVAAVVKDLVESIPDSETRRLLDLACFKFGTFDPVS
jgi:hypothetical protein